MKEAIRLGKNGDVAGEQKQWREESRAIHQHADLHLLPLIDPYCAACARPALLLFLPPEVSFSSFDLSYASLLSPLKLLLPGHLRRASPKHGSQTYQTPGLVNVPLV